MDSAGDAYAVLAHPKAFAIFKLDRERGVWQLISGSTSARGAQFADLGPLLGAEGNSLVFRCINDSKQVILRAMR